jgi:hypothetical protein
MINRPSDSFSEHKNNYYIPSDFDESLSAWNHEGTKQFFIKSEVKDGKTTLSFKLYG